MITEDYVSFETAKLLKEKGFDEYCRTIYNVGVFCSVASLDCRWNEGYGELIEEKQNSDFGIYDNAISAPTLQMAMKWLREIYKIEIWVHYDIDKTTWWGGCNPMYEEDEENSNMFQSLLGFDYPGKTYEEACEEAIKHCLENLI